MVDGILVDDWHELSSDRMSGVIIHEDILVSTYCTANSSSSEDDACGSALPFVKPSEIVRQRGVNCSRTGNTTTYSGSHRMKGNELRHAARPVRDQHGVVVLDCQHTWEDTLEDHQKPRPPGKTRSEQRGAVQHQPEPERRLDLSWIPVVHVQ